MKIRLGHPELVEGSVQLQPRFVGEYFVYILTNNTQVLYIGMTNNLDSRLYQHIRDRSPGSFAARYNLDRLIYYEVFSTPIEAIAREKQLKGWSREKKKKLIRGLNPMWKDLSQEAKRRPIVLPEGL